MWSVQGASCTQKYNSLITEVHKNISFEINYGVFALPLIAVDPGPFMPTNLWSVMVSGDLVFM